MEHETTLDDVLEAVNAGFSNVQEQFQKVDGRLANVEGRLENVEGRLTKVEGRLTNVESQMITKHFLEERLSKTDVKIATLTNVLQGKGVITEEEKRLIYS